MKILSIILTLIIILSSKSFGETKNNLSSNTKIIKNYKLKNKDKTIFGFCGGALVRKGLIYLFEA